MTPYFVQLTPEYGKVLVFAQDILLVQLLATVISLPEWLAPIKIEVTRKEDTDALLEHLLPGHPKLIADTPRTDRVSVTQESLTPLYLVHQMMVSLFISPSTMRNMIHAKSNAMGFLTSPLKRGRNQPYSLRIWTRSWEEGS